MPVVAVAVAAVEMSLRSRTVMQLSFYTETSPVFAVTNPEQVRAGKSPLCRVVSQSPLERLVDNFCGLVRVNAKSATSL